MSRKSSLVLKALNHRSRQIIIDLLDENDGMTFKDICSKLRLEQSVIKQHLSVLKRVGVVTISSIGEFILYSLDRNRLAQISRMIDEIKD